MNNMAFTLIQRSLGMNLIRTIFAFLDFVAFTLYKWATQAVFDIANVSLVSEGQFDEFAKRIYVVIGIFMLFKVTITMLNYLVDPEKINDKTEGLTKIIGRVLISICMLVGFPFVFHLIGNEDVTKTLLEAVPRIIIGKESQISTSQNEMGSFADTIVWKTYSIAFNIRQGEDDYIEVTEFNTMEAALENVNESTGDNSVYKYHYIPFVGMIIGLVMSFIMIGIAIDVAIRAFKLIILRMFAPIPILSYILPKSSKDGGTFNNWLKTLISTWADLFIKIGVVYFVLYMIDILILGNNVNFNVNGVRKIVVMIFVIIGLLLFAKQAPKFITDLLGIKNPKGSIGIGGMGAAGAALLGGAGIGGAIAAGATQLGEGAEAMAQGKSASGGWSKGRTIAARMKTGDPNAKPKGLSEKIGQGASVFQAKRKGITADSINDAKKTMYAANDAAADANALRERFLNGQLTKEDETTLKQYGISRAENTLNSNNIDKYVNARNTAANKAKSHYEKASSYAKQMGINVDKPLTEDIRINKRGSKYDTQYYNPNSGSGTSGLMNFELTEGNNYQKNQADQSTPSTSNSSHSPGVRQAVDESDME